MIQVRFIVEPLSIYRSGAPMISVEGSEKVKAIKKVKCRKLFCESNWNKISIS